MSTSKLPHLAASKSADTASDSNDADIHLSDEAERGLEFIRTSEQFSLAAAARRAANIKRLRLDESADCVKQTEAEQLSLLDTVALLENQPGCSLDDRDLMLRRGQVGTVVEAQDSDVVIVEFADKTGKAYALASVEVSKLLKLLHQAISNL